MTRLKSPQLTTEGLPASEPSQVPSDAPEASLSLPSPHLNHSAVYENEITNRLHGFKSAIAAIEGEIDGMERDHNQQVGELTASYEAGKAKKLALLEDIRKAEYAASKGLEAIQGYGDKVDQE